MIKYRLSQPQSFFEIGQRDNQEDAMYPPFGKATVDDRMFVVCDGMGGHEKGEVASNLVCSIFAKNADTLRDFTPQKLNDTIADAYDALDAVDDRKSKNKMGTTLAYLQLHSEGATIAHIGDSRVYYISPAKGKFFVTTDHSLVQSFYEAGMITKEQMRVHPQRNTITRSLMPHLAEKCKATIDNIRDLHAGDYFLLCSDGVFEDLDDIQIRELFLNTQLSDSKKCEKLKEMTEHSSDNHTAYIIRIEDVQYDDTDAEMIDWQSDSELFLEINESESEILAVDVDDEEELPQTNRKGSSRHSFIIALLIFLITFIVVLYLMLLIL